MSGWYHLGQVALAGGMVIGIYVMMDLSGKRQQRRLERPFGRQVEIIRTDPGRLQFRVTGEKLATFIPPDPNEVEAASRQRYEQYRREMAIRSYQTEQTLLRSRNTRPHGPPVPPSPDDYDDPPLLKGP